VSSGPGDLSRPWSSFVGDTVRGRREEFADQFARSLTETPRLHRSGGGEVGFDLASIRGGEQEEGSV
jgi:hypothetical protein